MCRPPDEKLPWLGISRVSAQRVACSKRFRLLHLAARVRASAPDSSCFAAVRELSMLSATARRRGPVLHAGPQFEVFQGMRGRLREWRDRVWPCVLYTVNGMHFCALIRPRQAPVAHDCWLPVARSGTHMKQSHCFITHYSIHMWGRVHVGVESVWGGVQTVTRRGSDWL